MLGLARAKIGARVGPDELGDAIASGALVIDIRPEERRRRDGDLPGAMVVERNVLEWRLDPTCEYRLAEMDDPRRRIIIACNEGYASSLAAAALLDLGLSDVTDLDGGFQAWRAHRASEAPDGGSGRKST